MLAPCAAHKASLLSSADQHASIPCSILPGAKSRPHCKAHPAQQAQQQHLHTRQQMTVLCRQ